MNRKGNVTKQAIKESAHLLFSEKGFKDVTMQDICDKTDLSRGGLYRHYDGTIQIFEEILHDITNQDYDDIYKLMKDGVPAREIIEREFNKLQSEMFDDKKSLNYAIYEYSNSYNNNYIMELNKKSEQKWTEFINYGIERKEFKSVEIDPLITLILYLYQGIRMWNRIVPIKKENIKKYLEGFRRVFMKITLVRPTIELKQKALDYKAEHIKNGENIIYGSELLDKMDSYEEWFAKVTQNSSKETVDKNWVVTDTFFAIDETDSIVGIIDLRHELNDFLINLGNSGYSVRPSARKKGCATEMLRLLTYKAKKVGLKEIRVSVERSNIDSIKVIKKNNGYYERSFEYEGKPADIFIIKL